MPEIINIDIAGVRVGQPKGVEPVFIGLPSRQKAEGEITGCAASLGFPDLNKDKVGNRAVGIKRCVNQNPCRRDQGGLGQDRVFFIQKFIIVDEIQRLGQQQRIIPGRVGELTPRQQMLGVIA